MALRFLAAHCISKFTVQTVRDAKHEVFRVRDLLPVESADALVVAKAQEIDAVRRSLHGDFVDIVTSKWTASDASDGAAEAQLSNCVCGKQSPFGIWIQVNLRRCESASLRGNSQPERDSPPLPDSVCSRHFLRSDRGSRCGLPHTRRRDRGAHTRRHD